MDFKTPGQLKSVEEFRARWREIAPELGCDEELLGQRGPLGRAFEQGDLRIGNRFAIHPMEGWDGTSEGLPSEDTLRRWRRFGLSGAKLIWGGEAVAVQADGRANPNQLFLNPEVDSTAGFARLRGELLAAHAEAGLETDDLYIGLQLTHSGRFARPTAAGPAPRIAYRHPVLDARAQVESDAAILSDGELEQIALNYVAAARAAQAAGYDFVDVKCCHGYLLHELLGAKTRPGPYGGSFENRSRFFRELVQEIRAACPGLDVAVRVSIGDLFPFSAGVERRGEPRGWDEHLPYSFGFGVREDDPRELDLGEGLLFLELVRSLGIRLVNLTLGSPYYNPHLQRPAAYPPCDGYQPPEDPLHQVAQHLRVARRCKAAFPGLAFVGTGYTYLQEWLPHVAQHEVGGGHVDFVGLGRMVLSYPELPRDVLAGRALARKKICRTFSDCTSGPRNGLPSGCYPLDEHYRSSEDARTLEAIKERLR
jgi:2,4-dienoyl-CoA reductase-like NADH-dependent reductase (Old Yellow Enzyme family)